MAWARRKKKTSGTGWLKTWAPTLCDNLKEGIDIVLRSGTREDGSCRSTIVLFAMQHLHDSVWMVARGSKFLLFCNPFKGELICWVFNANTLFMIIIMTLWTRSYFMVDFFIIIFYLQITKPLFVATCSLSTPCLIICRPLPTHSDRNCMCPLFGRDI